MTDDAPVDPLSADEAFGLLGDETRIRILQVLGEADDGLSFSALYDRVDYDTTSNFSYHLEQLLGTFVHKRDGRYELTWTGKVVVRSVMIAGTFAPEATGEPTELSARCPFCESPVEVSALDNFSKVRCTGCVGFHDHQIRGFLFTASFPPAGLVDRTPEEAFRAMVTKGIGDLQSFHRGVCPFCTGRTTRTMTVCREHDVSEGSLCDACGRRRLTSVSLECSRCSAGYSKVPGGLLLRLDPTLPVRAGHGGFETPIDSWSTIRQGFAAREAFAGQDPVRVRFALESARGRVAVTTDDSLSILEVEGRPRVQA